MDSVITYFLLIIINVYVLEEAEGVGSAKKCYKAKICVHDNVEKCGEDESGELRRFLDTCDIEEFNCLYNKDFDKTSMNKCRHLKSVYGSDYDINESKLNIDEALSNTDETYETDSNNDSNNDPEDPQELDSANPITYEDSNESGVLRKNKHQSLKKKHARGKKHKTRKEKKNVTQSKTTKNKVDSNVTKSNNDSLLVSTVPN